MDPNACLVRIREVCLAMDNEADGDVIARLADELVTLVQGLDEWLKLGGFLPSDWAIRGQRY